MSIIKNLLKRELASPEAAVNKLNESLTEKKWDIEQRTLAQEQVGEFALSEAAEDQAYICLRLYNVTVLPKYIKAAAKLTEDASFFISNYSSKYTRPNSLKTEEQLATFKKDLNSALGRSKKEIMFKMQREFALTELELKTMQGFDDKMLDYARGILGMVKEQNPHEWEDLGVLKVIVEGNRGPLDDYVINGDVQVTWPKRIEPKSTAVTVVPRSEIVI